MIDIVVDTNCDFLRHSKRHGTPTKFEGLQSGPNEHGLLLRVTQGLITSLPLLLDLLCRRNINIAINILQRNDDAVAKVLFLFLGAEVRIRLKRR